MLATARRFAPLVALLTLAACHDATGPGPEGSGPLRVLERPLTTDHDTVDTWLPGALRIGIYDSAGNALPKRMVSIRAVSADTTTAIGAALFVGYPGVADEWWGLGAGNGATALWLPTDSAGELRVPIRFGRLAGRVGARVSLVGDDANSGYTVWFTVHPGAAMGIALLPHDTAVYVERTYQLRALVLDRYGNVRPEQPTVAGDSSAATVTSAGLVTGKAFGRVRHRAAWGAFTDTAWASVVPHGTLSAIASYPSRLILVNLDGSEYRATEKSVGYITWAPSGTRMAIQDNGGATPYCYYEGFAAVLDTLGSETQLLPVGDCSSFMEAQRSPHFSHDEAWVYFERARYASGPGSFGSTIFRIHPDGTGLEPVIAPTDTAALAGMDPAPSPSGRYLAYRTYDPYPDLKFRVLDTSTGVTTTITGADGARWMQRADTLVALSASISRPLVLLRPDGSEVRSVPHGADWPGSFPYALSPDGQWAVVQRGVLELVNLESGLELPLAFTVGMGSPAWRP